LKRTAWSCEHCPGSESEGIITQDAPFQSKSEEENEEVIGGNLDCFNGGGSAVKPGGGLAIGLTDDESENVTGAS
jgi:hypothetical protein